MPLFKKKRLKKDLGRMSAWAALSSVKNEQEHVQSDIVATGLVWVVYRGLISGRCRVLRGVGPPFTLLPSSARRVPRMSPAASDGACTAEVDQR